MYIWYVIDYVESPINKGYGVHIISYNHARTSQCFMIPGTVDPMDD